MPALHATDADFATAVNSGKPTLVEFGAAWCGPCRQVAPILDQIADEHADTYTVVKVDIDTAPETTRQYAVMGVPTFVVLDPTGRPVEQWQGPKPKNALVASLAAAV